MGCACKGRDGPESAQLVAAGAFIAGEIFYSEPEWDEFLGCLECDSVGIALDILGLSGSECSWSFEIEQSVDGRTWAVTDTLFSGAIPVGDKTAVKVGFVPTRPFARIKGLFVTGSSPGPLYVKARATRLRAKEFYEHPVETRAPDPEDPEAMARRLVAESLMAEPKVMAALRELARQTLAEERSARALAERRSPQPRLVLDKILNSSIVTALSDCEHELFLGDYDRLALFVEAMPTALSGSPTITIDRLASLDGRSFFTAQTLNAGVSLPATGLFLHTGSVSPGAGRGRISVTIAAGGGSWTGRIRIWATPWFEEEEAAEHLAGPPAGQRSVGGTRGGCPVHCTSAGSGTELPNHNPARDPLDEERRST